MSAYIAFTIKEFTENIRTYKLFIMGTVFLLLGMMNPVVAKITPELLNTALPDMNINLPDPTALDSWIQFFSNVGQMGFLTLVIIFCGITANELSRGTLINMLTKGMRRSTVIFSKLTAASVIWTVSYLLCFFVSYFYTLYFWNMNEMHNALLVFFSPWLYGELLIALVIFGGILFKNIYGSLLLAGGAVIILSIINIAPKLQKYNPVTLINGNITLMTGEISPADFTPALIICSFLILSLIAASIAVFDKKQV